ncbi:MAG: DUF4191 domain-containing protein, partial [Propionibacteriaceae bacterium]
RKRHSDNPADWNQWRQIKETYKATVEADPGAKPLLWASTLGPILGMIALGIVLMLTVHMHWLWLIVLVTLGAMLALVIGSRILMSRAKAASFKRYDGQAGSGELALRMLDTKKWYTETGIAFTKNQDMVHRALGPGGLILIGEGEPGRLKSLLATEAKRHEAALYSIKPQIISIGKGAGQIPLDQVAKHISKLPKTLTPGQIDEANKRLKALDSVRQRVPMPKGPMPTRTGSRSAMRGR